ncbi:MAG: hypothetical protein QOF48_1751 [Verrucomicrobiota bacterium]|jgi:hypothetical protein
MKAILLLCTVAVACLAFDLRAASVGPGGYTTEFTTLPTAADWSGRGIGGLVADIVTSNDLQMAVQLLDASTFTAPLTSTSSNPPIASAAGAYCDAGYIQTRPNNVSFTALMATLRNTTGSNVTTVKISYKFATNLLSAEQVVGQLVFYSLTGDPGSWVIIPPFSIAQKGTLTASLNISWNDGMPLYLLFADDNGPGTDTSCEIDSFAVMTSGGARVVPHVNIISPTEGSAVLQGVNMPVSVVSSSAITSVNFYDGATFVGTDTSYPFSITYSNMAPGLHSIQVIGFGNISSPIVHVTIVSNHPPTVALTTVPGGTVLVGSNIVNTAVVTDNDTGGSIAHVEFYLDGTLKYTDTTFPYTYDYSDATVGQHRIQAVAVDQFGARGTNANTLIATNPTDVVVLVPNGSTWKYFDQGIDQGTAWRQLGFNDVGWSNGVAELGYGDGEGRRPEVTVVGFGTNSAAKYPTTYFRKTFNVSQPNLYGNLIVRLLRDDGGVVYINGTEVFRSYMTNGLISYGTLAGPAGAGPQVEDDGTFYQVTNVNPSVLVSGLNVVAVEIHQEDPGSSDISFDLMLWAQGRYLTLSLISQTQAVVSWTAPSAGYVLQSKTNLNSASWNAVTEPDMPDATSHHVLIDTAKRQRFFRLFHP